MPMRNLYIKWEKKNELGIAILDEQHRSLVGTINSLYYTLSDGKEIKGFELLLPILITVQEYTKFHFAAEEELLSDSRYPCFEEHQRLHLELVKKTEAIVNDCLRNRDPQPFLNFLKDWWLDHINVRDRAYAVHLKQYLYRTRVKKMATQVRGRTAAERKAAKAEKAARTPSVSPE